MQALRNKAMLDIRTAEARANAGRPVIDPKTLDEYKEGPSAQKVSGALTRVECLGNKRGCTLLPGNKPPACWWPIRARWLSPAAGKSRLTCGVQRPGRSVTVEYQPRTMPGMGRQGMH